MNEKKLTTTHGAPVENDLSSITAGEHGPTLLQDVHLLDKLAHFDRERTPDRVVHAKGGGAHGYFEVTHDITDLTGADFLRKVGKRTDVFARFSTVGGEKGSADSERDPRGFAVKFYTDEGIYDLVGNNTPVFFIRDALKFPDFIHTQKRHPATNLKDPDMFWDFLSLTPESIHQVTILFSDRGTPLSFRHNHGFGGHAFMWYTGNGDYSWVKIHFISDQKAKSLTRQEADALKSTDPDHAIRDLHENIKAGNFPSWTVCYQIMTREEAKTYRFDPFDVTKVWFHGDYPLKPFGKMVLNRNPENFYAETEQVAFSPGNFVPGIGPSPDKMLMGRIFSYPDTHRHRLGANSHLLPINASRSPVQSNERDGFMRSDANGGGSPNYSPNSLGGVAPSPRLRQPALDVAGLAAHHDFVLSDVDFVQPGELYRRVFNQIDRDHLIGNIAAHLGGAMKRIQLRQTALFYKVDKDYGEKVAAALGLRTEEVKRLAEMSQEDRVSATAQ